MLKKRKARDEYDMMFTEEQIEMIIPDSKSQMTEDEYIAGLKYDNEGVDYGPVMNYDPEEAQQINSLLKQMVSV